MRQIACALVSLSCAGRKVFTEALTDNADEPSLDSLRNALTTKHPLYALRQTLFMKPSARSPSTRFNTLEGAASRSARARSRSRLESLGVELQSEAPRSTDPSIPSGKGAKEPIDFSVVYLMSCAALWGTYPSTIKLLFSSPGVVLNSAEVTLARFLVMGLASYGAYSVTRNSSVQSLQTAGEMTWEEQFNRRVPSSTFLAASELGAIGLVGSYFNVEGLRSISGLTGAVLLTFLNVFTPLTAVLFGATDKERSVDRVTWITSLAAFGAAIYALLPDAPPDTSVSSLPAFGEGERNVLTAAFFFAANKVRLSSLLKVHDVDELSTGRLVAQAGLAAGGLALVDETNLLHELLPSQQGGLGMSIVEVIQQGEGWLRGLSPDQAFWIIVSALLSGTFATWCQGNGQARVSAPKAQLFYSTSPIFAAIWARLLLAEPITNHEMLGGVALLIGIVVASFASDSQSK